MGLQHSGVAAVLIESCPRTVNLSSRSIYRSNYDDGDTVIDMLQQNLNPQDYALSAYNSMSAPAEILMSPNVTKIGCATQQCGGKKSMLCVTDEKTTSENLMEEPSAATNPSRPINDAAYCSGGSLTESQINCQILSFINHKRFALANGMQRNGYCEQNCELLPRAKNMNKLAWSCDLERKALDAVKCSWGEPPDNGHGFAFVSEYDYEDSMSDIVRALVSKIDYSNFTLVNYEGVVYSGSSSERLMKGYANLMRSTATKIGCVHKICYDFGTPIFNFYCITDQPDIKEGDKIYETGSGSCDCADFCDSTGLCTVSRPAPTCIEAIFPKPTIEDPDTICAHGDMTDALRILMMDMHNVRRAQLARGQLKYSGNMLPSATNMNRLVWSCTLEKEAHDHLAKCPTEGYIEPSCLSPVDNFYRAAITSDISTFKEMTIKTIRVWWDVYQNYPNPGSSAVFTESLVGTPIESYTRMGWAQTREIGCSIAKCGDEYVLSCRYRPNGNIVNNPMYNVGLVCSECYIFGAGSCGSGGLCG
ncbi:unnamed protein product [Cylicocyclus nassatus]|uniref:SCP domain-containing protein n=1 Tax=Cylicocyclus nassatus TaxID=53992 RepID=A0AA36M902_CYLNA|nr:unnamed protein product [Cylicocyclus nassatus]